MDISKILEWIKLGTKQLVAISVVLGFAIFAPEKTLQIFGIDKLVGQYRPFFGGAFLLSAALVIVNLISALASSIANLYIGYSAHQRRKRRLKSLNFEEKKLLRTYIDKQTRTQYFGLGDGIITQLEMDGIIFRSSNVGSPHSWAFNIQPWAWDYLNKHSELLDIKK